ncbi:MAG: leucine-rich repeat protein [Clostridia bacterium]|nr:leucine-rich repeat protein [Clostridia bacterium]
MKTRRLLAWVVAALMLLTSFSLPGVREAEAASDVTTPTSPKGAEEKYYSDSGMCGPNLHWEYYSNTQKLVITGSGNMYEYDEGCTPWVQLGFASDITSVSLPKGLTSIGSYSFYKCYALSTIAIPGKVKTIGENAFDNCTSLMSVDLPKSVKQVDWYAFYHCYSLTSVKYDAKAADRVKIIIRDGNQDLLSANWTYKKANTDPLVIKTQPKDIKTNDGKYVVFKVKATGATSIQWQYLDADDPDVESNWQNAGVTSDSLTVWADYDHNGYRYRALVSNGTTPPLPSSAATLTVNYAPLKIKSQPKKKITADGGKKVSFKVKAQGAVTYIWQYLEPWGDPDNDSDWSLWGHGTDTLTTTAEGYMSAWPFRCIVYDSDGNHETSNSGQLFVNVKIKKQPKSFSVLDGESAVFSVDAAGATGYSWECKYPGEKIWCDCYCSAPVLSLSDCPIEDNGTVYRCLVYNETSYKISSTAKLTVKSAPDTVEGSYRALLIGENEYSSDPLDGCVNDMSAMAGMLRGLKNKFSVRTLPNSSRSKIMTAIDSTFSDATSESVSVFYYAGHGSSSGAICPISGGNITFAELASKLNAIPGRVIVILDSCFSGAAINKSGNGQDTDQMIQAYNQAAIDAFSGYRLPANEKSGELAKNKFVVITAASKTETSSDWYFDNSGIPQGEFTAALIQGMGCTYPSGAYTRHMPADADGDNCITLREIYEYARDTALYWDGAQHAQYYGNLNEVLFRRQ